MLTDTDATIESGKTEKGNSSIVASMKGTEEFT
jgi:hypothetical protein